MEVDRRLSDYIIAADGFLLNKNPSSKDSKKFDDAIDVIEKLAQEEKEEFCFWFANTLLFQEEKSQYETSLNAIRRDYESRFGFL